jgi:hypothetical protein
MSKKIKKVKSIRKFLLISLIPATAFLIYSFLQNPRILGASTTSNYTLDESIFPNPERGFHIFSSIYPGSILSTSTAKNNGDTLIHVNFRLDTFATSAISTDMLNTITNTFNTARNNGVKLIVRFVYNASSVGTDASEAQINIHLQQLKPILTTNSDVIAAFDAGFIGRWGEWNNSSNGLLTTATETRIYKNILANFPSDRQVQLRTPAFIRNISSSLTTSEKAKIGHYNDCFLANTSDMGTYSNPDIDKTYLATISLNSIIGGETCAVSTRSICSTAVAEMQQLHFSYLNQDYHPNVISGWKTNGCFNTIKKKLGYRLSLVNTNYPTLIGQGDSFNFKATIKNDGFASIYNPRKIYLVLYNNNYSYKLPLSTDPRNWKSNTLSSLNEVVIIPTNTVSGNYNLALWLPDNYDSLKSKPAYSIRLANLNTWVPTLGYNLLATNITIGNVSAITTTPTKAFTPTSTPTLIPTKVPTPTNTSTSSTVIHARSNISGTEFWAGGIFRGYCPVDVILSPGKYYIGFRSYNPAGTAEQNITLVSGQSLNLNYDAGAKTINSGETPIPTATPKPKSRRH